MHGPTDGGRVFVRVASLFSSPHFAVENWNIQSPVFPAHQGRAGSLSRSMVRRVIIKGGFCRSGGRLRKTGRVKEMSRRRWHCPDCGPGKPCAKCLKIGATHSMMLNECVWCGRRCLCYEWCGCWPCRCEQMNMYDDLSCSACGRPRPRVQ